MSDQQDTLAARLAPYRATPGIVAALLVSHDGFVVAEAAADAFASGAVAAQIAGVIDLSKRLAGELGQTAAKYVSFELDSLNVVLAPFGDELMLVLIGSPDALICEFHLKTPDA